MADQLLTIANAAALLGVSRATLYRAIAHPSSGLLTVTIGRRRLVPASEIALFVDRRAAAERALKGGG